MTVLRVLPGGAAGALPRATGTSPHPSRRDAVIVAALARCLTAWSVASDGAITVTFDKRAALAVRALLTWKDPR